MSKPIAIQRGCRQGDPIVPYLFLMVTELTRHYNSQQFTCLVMCFIFTVLFSHGGMTAL